MKRFCLILLLIAAVACSVSAAAVERWGRFELAMKAKTSSNPFDVELTATFSGPDTTMTVSGFYAGNGVFKVRFMPKTVGKWTYVTHSSLEALDSQQGSFECVSPSAGNHGPVVVDGRYAFKYADGTRYYPHRHHGIRLDACVCRYAEAHREVAQRGSVQQNKDAALCAEL